MSDVQISWQLYLVNLKGYVLNVVVTCVKLYLGRTCNWWKVSLFRITSCHMKRKLLIPKLCILSSRIGALKLGSTQPVPSFKHSFKVYITNLHACHSLSLENVEYTKIEAKTFASFLTKENMAMFPFFNQNISMKTFQTCLTNSNHSYLMTSQLFFHLRHVCINNFVKQRKQYTSYRL